jgi:hypothetical protein
MLVFNKTTPARIDTELGILAHILHLEWSGSDICNSFPIMYITIFSSVLIIVDFADNNV